MLASFQMYFFSIISMSIRNNLAFVDEFTGELEIKFVAVFNHLFKIKMEFVCC